jgi:hypothetical protein
VFQRGRLAEFYADTSFVPFAALAAGRQPWRGCVDELPYAAFAAGCAAAAGVEAAGLRFLGAL